MGLHADANAKSLRSRIENTSTATVSAEQRGCYQLLEQRQAAAWSDARVIDRAADDVGLLHQRRQRDHLRRRGEGNHKGAVIRSALIGATRVMTSPDWLR